MRNVSSGITRRRFTTMIATPLILGAAQSAAAQRGEWEHLGTKEIEGRVDHDKISCHGKDEYRALQFRVSGAAVQFDRIQVEYGNHQTRAYPFRMGVDQETHPLDRTTHRRGPAGDRPTRLARDPPRTLFQVVRP